MEYVISDAAKKKLEEFKRIFWQVRDYNGDDELISSVNDEYNFDQDDIIRTDGSVNFFVHTVENVSDHSSYIRYTVAVRGASYLIRACRTENKVWIYELFIDRPYIESKYDEVLRQYEGMKKSIDDVAYYMDNWRSIDNIIEDETDTNDIY